MNVSTHFLSERRQPAPDLQRRYAELNQQLFNGTLPTIPIYWDALTSMGGKVQFKVKVQRDDWGRVQRTLIPESVFMVITNVYQRDQANLDGLLVHEMIHVWFAAVEHDYHEQHGPLFMRKLRELQATVDFTIPLTDGVAGLDVATHVKTKPVYLVWGTARKGTTNIFQFLPDKYGTDPTLQSTVHTTLNGDVERGYLDPGIVILKMDTPRWAKLRLASRIPRVYTRGYFISTAMYTKYPEAVAEANAATPVWTSTAAPRRA